jgi:hypothetical protein
VSGGIVVVVERRARKTTVLTVEGTRRDDKSRWCVRVWEREHRVETGDQVWWEGKQVYWSPREGVRRDIPLTKIGYAFPPGTL